MSTNKDVRCSLQQARDAMLGVGTLLGQIHLHLDLLCSPSKPDAEQQLQPSAAQALAGMKAAHTLHQPQSSAAVLLPKQSSNTVVRSGQIRGAAAQQCAVNEQPTAAHQQQPQQHSCPNRQSSRQAGENPSVQQSLLSRVSAAAERQHRTPLRHSPAQLQQQAHADRSSQAVPDPMQAAAQLSLEQPPTHITGHHPLATRHYNRAAVQSAGQLRHDSSSIWQTSACSSSAHKETTAVTAVAGQTLRAVHSLQLPLASAAAMHSSLHPMPAASCSPDELLQVGVAEASVPSIFKQLSISIDELTRSVAAMAGATALGVPAPCGSMGSAEALNPGQASLRTLAAGVEAAVKDLEQSPVTAGSAAQDFAGPNCVTPPGQGPLGSTCEGGVADAQLVVATQQAGATSAPEAAVQQLQNKAAEPAAAEHADGQGDTSRGGTRYVRPGPGLNNNNAGPPRAANPAAGELQTAENSSWVTPEVHTALDHYGTGAGTELMSTEIGTELAAAAAEAVAGAGAGGETMPGEATAGNNSWIASDPHTEATLQASDTAPQWVKGGTRPGPAAAEAVAAAATIPSKAITDFGSFNSSEGLAGAGQGGHADAGDECSVLVTTAGHVSAVPSVADAEGDAAVGVAAEAAEASFVAGCAGNAVAAEAAAASFAGYAGNAVAAETAEASFAGCAGNAVAAETAEASFAAGCAGNAGAADAAWQPQDNTESAAAIMSVAVSNVSEGPAVPSEHPAVVHQTLSSASRPASVANDPTAAATAAAAQYVESPKPSRMALAARQLLKRRTPRTSNDWGPTQQTDSQMLPESDAAFIAGHIDSAAATAAAAGSGSVSGISCPAAAAEDQCNCEFGGDMISQQQERNVAAATAAAVSSSTCKGRASLVEAAAALVLAGSPVREAAAAARRGESPTQHRTAGSSSSSVAAGQRCRSRSPVASRNRQQHQLAVAQPVVVSILATPGKDQQQGDQQLRQQQRLGRLRLLTSPPSAGKQVQQLQQRCKPCKDQQAHVIICDTVQAELVDHAMKPDCSDQGHRSTIHKPSPPPVKYAGSRGPRQQQRQQYQQQDTSVMAGKTDGFTEAAAHVPAVCVRTVRLSCNDVGGQPQDTCNSDSSSSSDDAVGSPCSSYRKKLTSPVSAACNNSVRAIWAQGKWRNSPGMLDRARKLGLARRSDAQQAVGSSRCVSRKLVLVSDDLLQQR